MIKATPSQQATLRRICRFVNEHDIVSADYEIKTWEVKPLFPDGVGGCPNSTIDLLAVSGLKSDEGTPAEIFCRTSRHLFIGPKGGISAVINDKIVKGGKALFLSARN